MSSRAELDRIFPSLVKKYTDRRGYTDWFSTVEYLQLKEITTLRNRQWKWRNAESWWLRNRRRIKEGRARAKFRKESGIEDIQPAKSGTTENVGIFLQESSPDDQERGDCGQLSLDFS